MERPPQQKYQEPQRHSCMELRLALILVPRLNLDTDRDSNHQSGCPELLMASLWLTLHPAVLASQQLNVGR